MCCMTLWFWRIKYSISTFSDYALQVVENRYYPAVAGCCDNSFSLLEVSHELNLTVRCHKSRITLTPEINLANSLKHLIEM